MRLRSVVRNVLLSAAMVLAFAGSAAAQETTGSLAGQVIDQQGLAIPGASVTVTGPQGSTTVITDAEGRYVSPFLTPGIYSVRVELAGFKASEQQGVQIGLAQRTQVNVKLETGGITETVQVTGGSPVIDTRSTTVGGVLDPEQLNRLPVGRSLAATLYLVPGVSDSSGVGSANPSIGGASGLENNYIIDGVNITDVGFGGFGAYNSTFGSLGAGVTSDFIRETQVMTAGFEAEYGEASGGIVNVVTKSGSNAFNGSVFGYSRPTWGEAGWDQLTTPNGTVNTASSENHDAGISLGGRIVPNRVFFFGTYNPQWQNRAFTAPNNTNVIFPYASLGEVSRKRRIQAYAGKLTGRLNANHRLDFSVFGDPSEGLSGLQRFTSLRRIAYPGAPGTTDIRGGFSELEYGGHNQSIRYDAVLGSKWLLEANLANSSQKFNETPEVNEWNFTDLRPGNVPQGSTGGIGFFENNNGGNLQYGVKSTHILSGFGNHEIRYGVQAETINFTRATDYSGPPVPLSNGRTTTTGVPVQIRSGGGVTYYRATRGLLAPHEETTQDYKSFFIQDAWQFGRLTFRPGLRYERQYLEGVPPGGVDLATGVVDAPDLCFSGDERPGEGTGIGDPITCNFTWQNWAPRLGATFDLFGDGRAKVFASWGRFYAKIPNDLAARAMSADAGITRQHYRDAALTQPVPNGEVFAAVANNQHFIRTSDHPAIIDPEAGSTYKNEWLAGIEWEVLGNANLGFRYTRRTMPQILEDIGQLPIAGYFLGTDQPVDYFITNPNANTAVVQCCGFTAAFEDPSHTYDSFEVTLNKRFSGNWSAIASYRFSRLVGNFEGFFRSDNGQSDPAISSLFDFPTNDPSYTALADEHGGLGDIRYQGASLGEGQLPNDRPHQLKLYGSYLLRDVNLGFGFNAGSGRSLTAMGANPVYANAGEIPLTIRGAGIETVDGFRERTPAEISLDLHADYTFRLGGRRLTLLADAFNVFNRQTATRYDYFYETTTGVLNPNFGEAVNGGSSSAPSFAPPFNLRLGARFDW